MLAGPRISTRVPRRCLSSQVLDIWLPCESKCLVAVFRVSKNDTRKTVTIVGVSLRLCLVVRVSQNRSRPIVS